MATAHQFINKLKTSNPGFWNSLTTAQKQHYRTVAQNYVDNPNKGYQDFNNFVQGSNVYTGYQTVQTLTEGAASLPPELQAYFNTLTPDQQAAYLKSLKQDFTASGGSATDFLTQSLVSDPGFQPFIQTQVAQALLSNPDLQSYLGTLSSTDQQALVQSISSGYNGTSDLSSYVSNAVSQNPSYTYYQSQQIQQQATATQNSNALLAAITADLKKWNLPASLTSFIQTEITASKSYDEIINDLRNTPEYQAAFPENGKRIANGLSAWSEQQILEYRDQAKQIAQSQLGMSVNNAQITDLIANDISLPEWSHKLQTYATFQQWGPVVQQALSQELGYNASDEQTYAFMSAETPTPELDAAYQRALLRGQPAVLGFGMRPEEEANVLLQHGIDPAQAFAGYQGIAAELPRENRLALIDNAISNANTPDAAAAIGDTNFNTLFKAIQLRDPVALQQLSQTIAHETARWQAGGGVAHSGTQAVGLLTSAERRNP